MKQYQGTKVVQAEPMTELTAIELGLARKNKDNHELRHGYKVVYPDGYESWSPKNVFEQAYRITETFLDRMLLERDELLTRYGKLVAFIDTEPFQSLEQDERHDLLLQQVAMEGYLNALNHRIDRAKQKMEE